jgi:hypothetical protein
MNIIAKNMDAIQRLLVIVVVYRRCWNEVASANYLIEQLEKFNQSQENDLGFRIDKLIIYDNSPSAMLQPPKLDDRIDYKHNPENGGTRAAYDYALTQAIGAKQEWIFLLDQDTSLPDNFLVALNTSFSGHHLVGIDVLLPRVTDHGLEISPSYISRLGSIVQAANNSQYSHQFPLKGLTGIASGALIRTSSLNKISKLPPNLWLDFVDHWIFQQLNLNGAKYLILDITLQHQLSIMNMSEVSRQRMLSLLDGEFVFVGSLGKLAKITYPFRLLFRFLRFAIACPSAAKNMTYWLWLRVTR